VRSENKLSRLLTLAICALALLAGSSEMAFANKRVALVIGNSAYQNATPLLNPGKDANALADLFKKAGFDVVNTGIDLGSLDFKRRVREFSTIARDADIAVVFFAGHGIEVNGTNYLIPVDAKLASDFDADDEGVSLDRIIRTIEPARKLRLVIIDACRDNPFLRKMQRTVSMRAVTNGLAKIEPDVGDTLVAYAAKAGSTAEDGYGDHSPFTAALLKHLAVPGLDIRIAFGRVRDEVLKNTRGKQEPFVYGSLGGAHITLMPEAAKPAPPPPVASEDTKYEIRTRYEFAERIGTKAAWEYFLSAHPTGLYADLARAQLAKMAAAAPAGSLSSETALPAARKPDPGPPAPKAATAPPPAPPRQDEQARANASAAEAKLKAERDAQARLKADREAEEKRKTLAAVAPPPPAPAPARSCQQDEEALARLRSTRNGDDIVRFERDLFCDRLRPQLMRLKESVVGPTPSTATAPAVALPPPIAAAPPSAVPPSLPKGLSPARPSTSGEAEKSAPPPIASAEPQDACQRDEERLSRLRTTRVADEIVLFSRELTCERLRPQLLRLRESVVGR
jgi:hypothetical protein